MLTTAGATEDAEGSREDAERRATMHGDNRGRIAMGSFRKSPPPDADKPIILTPSEGGLHVRPCPSARPSCVVRCALFPLSRTPRQHANSVNVPGNTCLRLLPQRWSEPPGRSASLTRRKRIMRMKDTPSRDEGRSPSSGLPRSRWLPLGDGIGHKPGLTRGVLLDRLHEAPALQGLLHRLQSRVADVTREEGVLLRLVEALGSNRGEHRRGRG